jgi:hypothetical protein
MLGIVPGVPDREGVGSDALPARNSTVVATSNLHSLEPAHATERAEYEPGLMTQLRPPITRPYRLAAVDTVTDHPGHTMSDATTIPERPSRSTPAQQIRRLPHADALVIPTRMLRPAEDERVQSDMNPCRPASAANTHAVVQPRSTRW